jgi:hypothetical protein
MLVIQAVPVPCRDFAQRARTIAVDLVADLASAVGSIAANLLLASTGDVTAGALAAGEPLGQRQSAILAIFMNHRSKHP